MSLIQLAFPGSGVPDFDLSVVPDGASDEFYTPACLRDLLPAIDLDPCSPPSRPVRAQRHYVLAEGQDGFALPWTGPTVWCNPPFSRGNLPRWVPRCRQAWETGEAERVLAVVPVATGSTYWHRHVWGVAQVGFWSGRLRFETALGESDFPAYFDVALLVWAHHGDGVVADYVARTAQVGVRWVR